MIIDCHAHVFAWPKLPPNAEATVMMSVDDQIALMDAKGVDQAVILPLANAETLSESQSLGEILYICEQRPGRFIPFFNMDPRLPKRPEKIKPEDFDFRFQTCRDLGFKGIGEMIARLPWDHPALWSMCAAAEKYGFPITFHTITADIDNYGVIDEVGLPRMAKVLAAFPKLRLFGHSPGFWSEISGDVDAKTKNGYATAPVAPGGRVPELMRRHRNLYGDLSAGSGLNALKRDVDHACRFIDEFQDQLMLGLDYCSVKNDMQHIEFLTKLRDDERISDEAYQKIMYQNISRALELGLA